ncbi:unnamed protein product, partial [marine sediment metagenome]
MMRRCPRAFILPVMVVTVVICLGPGFLVAQDAPTNGPGAAQQPDSSSKSLLDFIKAGGPVGYVIILLSLAGIALVIEGFIQFKPENLLPPALTNESEQLA